VWAAGDLDEAGAEPHGSVAGAARRRSVRSRNGRRPRRCESVPYWAGTGTQGSGQFGT
jgi:hypothetical protein